MPCDFFVYESEQEYIRHYKHELMNEDRHIEIDRFYIFPNKQLWIILQHNKLPIRPQMDRSIVYIDINDLDKYLTNDPKKNPIKVTFKDSYYDPKSSKLLFLKSKRLLIFKKYALSIPVHRYFGNKPSKTSTINWNWFYDHLKKRVSFVLDYTPPSLD